jgi:ribosomal-protein-alanine N-acetyltransferase
MELSSCHIETHRLLIKEWHSLESGQWDACDLSDVVIALHTAPVTRSLPTAWQGAYTNSRALDWIDERDREGTTLLVISAETRQPVGLMIFSEPELDGVGDREIHIGYLLGETAWGVGMATEMVSGFVDWCGGQGLDGTLIAGVEGGNQPSRRVLEKNGFRLDTTDSLGTTGELLYRRRFVSL